MTVSATVEIPLKEPRELLAGDQWVWNRLFAEFPSNAWTLTYYVRGVGSLNITATEDIDTVTFDIVVPAVDTAPLVAGVYRWVAKVSNTGTGEVYTVDQNDFLILANYATAGPQDLQPNAEIMLAAINAEIAARFGLAANGSVGGPVSPVLTPGSAHEHMTIAGRELTKIPIKELHFLRAQYRAEVAMLVNNGILPPIAWTTGTRRGYGAMLNNPTGWEGP